MIGRSGKLSYFEDLTPYTYYHAGIKENTFNIGWLDIGYPYQCGEVPAEFLDKLWDLVQIRLFRLRGFHVCNLCSQTEAAPLMVKKDDLEFTLGDAEIRVLGEAGKIYAAPNLIYHYVTVHGYQPPEEFVRAVLTGPGPDSEIYRKLIAKF
jgi:hypothetical protein